ncbi:MAG: glycosyltransferase family 2 protein [Oscillospiraceae bacterium]|nr:glycosyltransferase family 2 protein [Oscillospiraceae bacterium]
MEFVSFLNWIIAILFVACYAYQFFYIFVSLVFKSKKSPDAQPKRYAALISARNEENVIANLIESIKKQKYPSELLDIYVVADNCTDSTAQAARKAGATHVWERFNNVQVGKGYALEFLFDRLKEENLIEQYDGYFVFDADNLLDENYVAEMNKTFCAGHRVVTSYRNSKNFGSNWISAGYSLWFLREARYLNNARMILGTSCAISGTGFLVHKDIILRNGGWKHFLLTEDIEFTVDNILKGEKIAYCPTAVFYDEQPVRFLQSWHQRMRWAKGYLQVFRHYGLSLIKGSTVGHNFSCFDMMMSIMPAIVLTMLSFVLNFSVSLWSILTFNGQVTVVLFSLLESLVNAYGLLFFLGGITLLTEWKNIYCSTPRKILSAFTFPLFMFTYIPISAVALFKKVEWKPIQHGVSKKLDDIRA